MVREDTPVLRSLKWKLARTAHFVNRFRDLPRSNRVFGELPKHTFVEQHPFGHRFIGDVGRGGPQRLIYLLGERFVEEAPLLKGLLRTGKTVADIGADVGYCLLLFAQELGSSGRIIAIEPSPENLGKLHANVARNRLANVRIVPRTVGAERRSVGLRSGISNVIAANGNGSYVVEQDTLDNIISEHVDLLTMDIEGYEGENMSARLAYFRAIVPSFS